MTCVIPALLLRICCDAVVAATDEDATVDIHKIGLYVATANMRTPIAL